MYRLIGLGLVLALCWSPLAYAQTCFVNSSQKAVSIKMMELLIDAPSVQIRPGQRRCFEERARFSLTADFTDELTDYWYNDLNQTSIISRSPRTWLERYLNGLIETGQLTTIVVQYADPRIAYVGPHAPFHEYDAIRNPSRNVDIEILLSEERAVSTNRRTKAALPPAAPKICPSQTILRSQSAHSYVNFKLPVATDGQEIRIPGGAHSRYYFPTCHRVHWNDHIYRCKSGDWQRVQGEAGADALCHGNTPNSPYIEAGYRE